MTTAHPLDDAPLSRFHKKLALYASGGPFLDGYVLSIIGVALVQISPKFGMSSAEEGLVGASALVGIFLGAFLGGWLTDIFGRQVLFTIDLAAIIACSIAQFFVGDVFWLIILRLLIGMAVGADYPIATSLRRSSPRGRGPLLRAPRWPCGRVGAAAAYLVGEILLPLRTTVGVDAGQRGCAGHPPSCWPGWAPLNHRAGCSRKAASTRRTKCCAKCSDRTSRWTTCPRRSTRTCASAP